MSDLHADLERHIEFIQPADLAAYYGTEQYHRCKLDNEDWPCDAARALAEIDRLAAERDEAGRIAALAIRDAIQKAWQKDPDPAASEIVATPDGDRYTHLGEAWCTCFDLANAAAHKGLGHDDNDPYCVCYECRCYAAEG
jgi:hypothetical protein